MIDGIVRLMLPFDSRTDGVTPLTSNCTFFTFVPASIRMLTFCGGVGRNSRSGPFIIIGLVRLTRCIVIDPSCSQTVTSSTPGPVTVTGPGVLDVTVWEQEGSMTIHLVNLTNPMMMKGPLREFLPTPPQKVSIRMLAGTKVKKVQLLVSGVTPSVRESNGSISLTIPSIMDHE